MILILSGILSLVHERILYVMRFLQWALVTLLTIVPFGLLALFFIGFSRLAFTLIIRDPSPWPTVAYELTAATLTLVTAALCGFTCLMRLARRPIGRLVSFSLGMAIVTIVIITIWRPNYFIIY